MKYEMKKQELKTGDIVVTRDGSVGIVLAEKEVILYPKSGMDFYDDLTEALLLEDDYRGGDIMEVYRAGEGEVIGFTDYEDTDPIFVREDETVPAEEMNEKRLQEIREGNAREGAEASGSFAKRDLLFGLIQGMYGNRTGIEFTEADIDDKILGYLGNGICEMDKKDRSVLCIPGEEGLVLVYNRYQEEEKLAARKILLEEGRDLKPLAEIPEAGIRLYSRCLACRMDAAGRLESLKEGDSEKLTKYLAE